MADDDDFAPAADRTATLRANFAAAVATILEGDDVEADGSVPRLPVSAGFAAHLTEVSWTWTTTALAPDLEAFARHAKRQKVGPDDVVLAARKNETTHSLLEREARVQQRSAKRSRE